MLEILAPVVLVALVVSGIFQHRNSRNSQRQLQEYRNLYAKAESSQKEGQAKIEGLFKDLSRKDILLDRSAQALEIARAQGVEFTEEVSGLKSQVSFQEEQYAKILNQKKSSEVRTGKITEQLAPFLEDYPLDPKTARFLGDPIDFVHFDEDKVTFIEVKSGKSQLSKKQRIIRDLIKAGKVEFIIYRVEGK